MESAERVGRKKGSAKAPKIGRIYDSRLMDGAVWAAVVVI